MCCQPPRTRSCVRWIYTSRSTLHYNPRIDRKLHTSECLPSHREVLVNNASSRTQPVEQYASTLKTWYRRQKTDYTWQAESKAYQNYRKYMADGTSAVRCGPRLGFHRDTYWRHILLFILTMAVSSAHIIIFLKQVWYKLPGANFSSAYSVSCNGHHEV